MKHHRYERISYPDFIVSPPGDPRQEIRNPERAVGRWLLAMAIVCAALVLAGII